MAAMSIGAVLVFLALIFCQDRSIQNPWRQEWQVCTSRIYFKLSLFLAVACGISLISAKLFPLSWGGHSASVHLLKDFSKVWYLFWPLLLLQAIRSISEIDRGQVYQSWLISFGVLSILGIFQYFSGWPRPQEIPNLSHRFHTTLFLGHHLSVASIFIFPFFAALDYARARKGSPSQLYWIIAAAGFFALILTYSRTLWVALPVGLILWSVWVLPKKWKIWVTFGILVAVSLALFYPPIYQRVHENLGITTRQDLWEANLEFFKNRPLFGVGLKQAQELSGYYLMEKYHTQSVFSGHAHNNILHMLGSTGIVGTMSWITWCLGVFWILWTKKNQKSSHPPHFTQGLICAWIVFQLNGLTQVNFWEAKVQHQIAWMIAWALL